MHSGPKALSITHRAHTRNYRSEGAGQWGHWDLLLPHTFFSRWPSSLQSRDPPAPPRSWPQPASVSIPSWSQPWCSLCVAPGQYLMPWELLEPHKRSILLGSMGLGFVSENSVRGHLCSQEDLGLPLHGTAIECRWSGRTPSPGFPEAAPPSSPAGSPACCLAAGHQVQPGLKSCVQTPWDHLALSLSQECPGVYFQLDLTITGTHHSQYSAFEFLGAQNCP